MMMPMGGGGFHMFIGGPRGSGEKKRPSIAMYRRLLRFVGPYRWNLAIAAARSDPSLALAPRRDAALASLGIDTTAPPFDRAEVRRAMAMAIDRGALSSVYAGLSRGATQLVPAGTLGYDDSVIEFAPLDAAAARKILADARVSIPIATELAYSERTVKTVIHDVTTRLQLRNRSHAVAYAVRQGLI